MKKLHINSDLHEFVHRDIIMKSTNEMQLYRSIYYWQRQWWILPDAVNTAKCSWWWAKTSPETCRAD